jgi:uncharacterized protein (TIGR02996 family)
MDRLVEHEAFLRAIFDAPDDDTPRLVYADFLEENGEAQRAEFIRVQCQRRRLLSLPAGDHALAGLRGLLPRENELQRQLAEANPDAFDYPAKYERGFVAEDYGVHIRPDRIPKVNHIREWVVGCRPHWFRSATIEVSFARAIGDQEVGPFRPVSPEEVTALLDCPAFQRVAEWSFPGFFEELAANPQTEDTGTYALVDIQEGPVIRREGVEALAANRGARRITRLILTNNNLDNDAARALIRSPYLINLKHLELLQGNRLRGRTWQELLDRFGEDVVS